MPYYSTKFIYYPFTYFANVFRLTPEIQFQLLISYSVIITFSYRAKLFPVVTAIIKLYLLAMRFFDFLTRVTRIIGFEIRILVFDFMSRFTRTRIYLNFAHQEKQFPFQWQTLREFIRNKAEKSSLNAQKI